MKKNAATQTDPRGEQRNRHHRRHHFRTGVKDGVQAILLGPKQFHRSLGAERRVARPLKVERWELLRHVRGRPVTFQGSYTAPESSVEARKSG